MFSAPIWSEGKNLSNTRFVKPKVTHKHVNGELESKGDFNIHYQYWDKKEVFWMFARRLREYSS